MEAYAGFLVGTDCHVKEGAEPGVLSRFPRRLFRSVLSGFIFVALVSPKVALAALAVSHKAFSLHLQVIELSKEVKETESQLQRAKQELAALENRVREAERRHLEAKTNATRVLRVLQKVGPISYLDFVFQARDLCDLLNKINLVFALIRSSSRAFGDLRRASKGLAEQRAQLNRAKAALDKLQDEMEKKRSRLEKALSERNELAKGVDLQALERASGLWFGELPPYMNALSEALREPRPMEISADDIDFVLDEGGLEIRVSDRMITDMLKRSPGLSTTEFHAGDRMARLEDGRNGIVLEGIFLTDGTALKYQIVSIRLAGILLDEESTAMVREKYRLQMDLRPLVGALRIKTVSLQEGYVVLRAEGVEW